MTATASSYNKFRETLARDFANNPRDPKAKLILAGFRICQSLIQQGGARRAGIAFPVVAIYRILTEFVLGVELRPKTKVGPGLTIYHGVGLVVNDHAQLGSNVTLRNGVTIGHKEPGGASPVLGDDVVVGAGAIILGGITIGNGAVIGAGAVVLQDVPAGATFAGNPARDIRPRPTSDVRRQSGSDSDE